MNWKPKDFPNIDYQRPNPARYLMSEELEAALKVAVALNQPLLITGEPGTGKTQLAHKAAFEFHRQDPSFLAEPFEFHTKTSSVAKDLLYSYDAVRHFHDAGIVKENLKEDVEYIELNALGKAILYSQPRAARGPFAARHWPEAALSSVVLVDEIDKAPRDFPNDLLHEFDRYEFNVPEIKGEGPFRRNENQRIVLILTSNSEKNLPEAFLRRCAFFHIPSPTKERLGEILNAHFDEHARQSYAAAEQLLIEKFLEIREAVTHKQPATAELLSWMRILSIEGLLEPIQKAGSLKAMGKDHRNTLVRSLSVLVKNSDDLNAAVKALKF